MAKNFSDYGVISTSEDIWIKIRQLQNEQKRLNDQSDAELKNEIIHRISDDYFSAIVAAITHSKYYHPTPNSLLSAEDLAVEVLIDFAKGRALYKVYQDIQEKSTAATEATAESVIKPVADDKKPATPELRRYLFKQVVYTLLNRLRKNKHTRRKDPKENTTEVDKPKIAFKDEAELELLQHSQDSLIEDASRQAFRHEYLATIFIAALANLRIYCYLNKLEHYWIVLEQQVFRPKYYGYPSNTILAQQMGKSEKQISNIYTQAIARFKHTLECRLKRSKVGYNIAKYDFDESLKKYAKNNPDIGDIVPPVLFTDDIAAVARLFLSAENASTDAGVSTNKRNPLADYCEYDQQTLLEIINGDVSGDDNVYDKTPDDSAT